MRRLPDGREERVFNELFTGDAWLREHKAVQQLPPVAVCSRPQAIAAMMFWSDATHLAQFGQSSIWPIYLQFGNRPKLDRSRPSKRLTEHIGYMPKMTASVLDEIIKILKQGKNISDTMAAHLKREIFHACWRILLDEEFINAYKHGIVVPCQDDYPERVLVGLIHDFGLHPLLLSLVKKEDLHKLGTRFDRGTRANSPRVDNEATQSLVLQARRIAYYEGHALSSKQIEDLLKPALLVPTINAFSQALSFSPSFDVYRILVPDELHELDLGVVKAILIYAIRLLHTQGQGAVVTLDSRLQQVPSFPPDIIRGFKSNVSEMKKLAARDFEDTLQGHALSKLRTHTDSTLRALDAHTTTLGRRFRKFQKVTSAIPTMETDRKLNARRKRLSDNPTAAEQSRTKKPKVATIKLYGATDSDTSQNCKLEHRLLKAWARRTNQHNIPQAIGTHERRIAHLEVREAALQEHLSSHNPSRLNETPLDQKQDDAGGDSDARYVIGAGGKIQRFITFIPVHREDPAAENFMLNLREHLALRFHPPSNPYQSIDTTQCQSIVFSTGAMYKHATLQINYTTYDIRRTHDTLNTWLKHHFVMLPNNDPDPDHPFLYAKILGIYHTHASPNQASRAQRVEFLWLDRVRYVRRTSPREMFGFVDPACIIRACHLIPAFKYGRTSELPRTSIAVDAAEGDWESYYVNRFVDRDMFMRYWGDGIGHSSVPQARAAETYESDGLDIELEVGSVENDEWAELESDEET
ncbi:hypothetical protein FRC07_001374 [Ceratobasidium sp. 392]|nr:hypothetical protein FRC07_001374 [Ceratobasidium sp. 392]